MTSAQTPCIGFIERALRLLCGHGITPRRLMTDNAWIYTKNRALARCWPRTTSGT